MNSPLESVQGQTTKIDTNKLKASVSFRRLLEADGHQLERKGGQYCCCCPFHSDSTPSFFLSREQDRAHCFGCGWSGDVIQYVQETRKYDFRRAIGYLVKSQLREPEDLNPSPYERVELIIPCSRSAEERQSYLRCLASDQRIQRSICEKRFGLEASYSWNPETLRLLAEEGSLGWAGDALTFHYELGLKFRKWPDKQCFWAGGPQSLWREAVIKDADEIFLTESETDAISLIDLGIEESGIGVVATPGASSFRPGWTEKFQGKKVTIIFDNDEAGRRGTETVVTLLRPHVKELYVIDWQQEVM